MDKAAVNQDLQFTSEIWTHDTYHTPFAKKEKVQTVANDEFHLLDMKMSCYHEEGLKFRLSRKKGQKLKYASNENTHTPGTLHVIPLGVLNCLAKLTFTKTHFLSERVYKVYPDHVNALQKAGLAPPVSPIT